MIGERPLEIDIGDAVSYTSVNSDPSSTYLKVMSDERASVNVGLIQGLLVEDLSESACHSETKKTKP